MTLRRGNKSMNFIYKLIYPTNLLLQTDSIENSFKFTQFSLTLYKSLSLSNYMQHIAHIHILLYFTCYIIINHLQIANCRALPIFDIKYKLLLYSLIFNLFAQVLCCLIVLML